MTIHNWNEVPIGAHVIEDTYNEIYEVILVNGREHLKQIGWQFGNRPIPPNNIRSCDFDPSSIYDQPWYVIRNG
jgi:hypothetical protein